MKNVIINTTLIFLILKISVKFTLVKIRIK